MNQGSRVNTPTGNQKIVFVTQRAQQQGQAQQTIQQQPNTVVKIMSNAGNAVSQPKMMPVQQKMVMMSNVSTTNTGSVTSQSSQVRTAYVALFRDGKVCGFRA